MNISMHANSNRSFGYNFQIALSFILLMSLTLVYRSALLATTQRLYISVDEGKTITIYVSHIISYHRDRASCNSTVHCIYMHTHIVYTFTYYYKHCVTTLNMSANIGLLRNSELVINSKLLALLVVHVLRNLL